MKKRGYMSTNHISNNRSSAAIVIIPILIILLPLFYSLFSYIFAQGDQGYQPFLERPDAKYKNCIRDTVYMRHNHWVLLKGVREEVVRHGKRDEISFEKCQECHTSRERFCDKCHDAVSLTPDCWSCHNYP